MNILLTSTSFQSITGKHSHMLKSTGWNIDNLSGPLGESDLISIIGKYDGVIMGDDEYTKKVLRRGVNLKVLSKYGTGLDKVDMDAAKKLNIRVCNVTGVNAHSVAEYAFALLLSYARHIPQMIRETKEKKWNRQTGLELKNKSLGILGVGKIGKEVFKIAKAFSMKVIPWDACLKGPSLEEVFSNSNIVTLHLPLSPSSKNLINRDVLRYAKDDLILLNTARGGIINQYDLREHLKSNPSSAYLADVLEYEPMNEKCLLNMLPNVFITPHVASRTRENIERQGLAAVKNLIQGMEMAKK